ncbi:MAG: ribonuclease P protein component [Oscillatoriales cyanobacterium C42_A2020_001]|nr:ribonuclease P protein component [Leptolyngbyaceae cyanobacterium C42_A2020_001]
MGLPRANRLKHREDFSRVHQKGRRFKADHLTLRLVQRVAMNQDAAKGVSPENGTSVSAGVSLPTRIGISISVKVDKRAVVRNRMRRQIQAIFRQFLPRLCPNLDLLIVAHPQAVQCDYFQFLQELEQLLVDAEVLNGDPGGCVL